MDRIQFIHSILPNNITTCDLFINYIDQSMLLYDLVPEDSTVSVSESNLDLISFDISTNDQSINELSNFLTNNPVIVKYRKPISIQYIKNKNNISITMRV